MIQVEVFFLAQLADVVGKRKLILTLDQGSTIDHLLKRIEEETSVEISKGLEKEFVLLKNGRNYHKLSPPKKELKTGDRITLIPVLGGGNKEGLPCSDQLGSM